MRTHGPENSLDLGFRRHILPTKMTFSHEAVTAEFHPQSLWENTQPESNPASRTQRVPVHSHAGVIVSGSYSRGLRKIKYLVILTGKKWMTHSSRESKTQPLMRFQFPESLPSGGVV